MKNAREETALDVALLHERHKVAKLLLKWVEEVLEKFNFTAWFSLATGLCMFCERIENSHNTFVSYFGV